MTAFRESGCALDDIQCQCTSSAFSNLFAECQAAVCGILDLQSTLHTTVFGLYNSHQPEIGLLPFTIKRCASVGIALSPSILSVESEIAYAIPTSTDNFPVPTDFTNAPNDVADLPACAVRAHYVTPNRRYGSCSNANREEQQKCIYSAASFAGCDIHNLTCICTSEDFNTYVGTCETGACTADELQGALIRIVSRFREFPSMPADVFSHSNQRLRDCPLPTSSRAFRRPP